MRTALVTLVLCLVVACGKKPAPQPPSAPAEASTPSGATPETVDTQKPTSVDGDPCDGGEAKTK